MMPALTDLTLDAGLLDSVRAVLERHPTLTANGFDPSGEPTRTSLLDYRGLCEVQGGIDYLVGRRRTIADAYSVGSYALKHQAESWHRLNGRQVYVSNGAFLIAAIISGFSLFQRRGDVLNRGVGIHRADIVTRQEKERARNRRAEVCNEHRYERRFGPVLLTAERMAMARTGSEG